MAVLQRRSLLILAFALIAGFYVYDLANTPVYFGGDEAHFAVGAHAIATTGRNVNGDRMPVFINLADPAGGAQQPWGDTWYQPLLFYVTALFVKLLPFTIATVRLPVALIGGLLTPLLLFAVARRMIGDDFPAAVAALIVALAPTHVVLSRQALDYVLPLPFVIVWLWCLHRYMADRERRHLVAASAILGIGCYSYIASWMIMPCFLLITWVLAYRRGATIAELALAAIAFAAAPLAGVAWMAAHPEMFWQTLARYGVTEGPKYGLLETYASLLKPTVLFLRGGASPVTSTARSGFVLAPAAVLLVAGVVALLRRRDWVAFVIAAGLIVAPVPAAFKGEPTMIQRATYVLPFLGLLGGFGLAYLWRSSSRWMHAVVVAVLAASVVQFGYFYFDYFGHYKLRSAFYYDPAAFHDVSEYLLTDAGAPAFYFTDDVDDAPVKWRFYALQRHREDAVSRAHYVGTGAVPAAPLQSLFVTYDLNDRLEALKRGGWVVEKLISDVDQRPAAVILRKVQ